MALSDDRTDSYVKQLRTLLNPTVQLALLVVPQQKSDRYAAIKKFCCLEMPVPSQVVCVKTINNEKRLNAVAQKIALQINVRLICTNKQCILFNQIIINPDFYQFLAPK